MLHQWFTCVHLLDTYLANLTEGFQLSFTTHQFPSEQHKVVCNQHLHAECGGSDTISLEVTTEIHQYSQHQTSFCLRTHIHSAKIQKLLQNIDVFNIFNAGKKIICRKWAGFGIFFISLQRIYKDIYSIYKRYIKSRSIYS